MAFIMQQTPSRVAGSRLMLKKLAIDVVKVAMPRSGWITADAIDNLSDGEKKQAELQLRVLPGQRFNQLHQVGLASGTIPTRSCPTIWLRQIAASASARRPSQRARARSQNTFAFRGNPQTAARAESEPD